MCNTEISHKAYIKCLVSAGWRKERKVKDRMDRRTETGVMVIQGEASINQVVIITSVSRLHATQIHRRFKSKDTWSWQTQIHVFWGNAAYYDNDNSQPSSYTIASNCWANLNAGPTMVSIGTPRTTPVPLSLSIVADETSLLLSAAARAISGLLERGKLNVWVLGESDHPRAKAKSVREEVSPDLKKRRVAACWRGKEG